MFIASKIAIGYLGYLSIKNKKKESSKNDNIDKNDYDNKIDEILQKKKENNELIIHKKQKIDNYVINRNIKTKEECDKIFQKFLKNNNQNNQNIISIEKPKLFNYEIRYNNILLNYINNYIYFDLHLQKNKIYKLYIEFEISNINHINFLLTNNIDKINIQFENIFKDNKVTIIINNLTNLKDVTLYILFKNLYKSTYIKNIYFYIMELKIVKEIINNNQHSIIIYKNNDVIKQIFYETQNIFLLNNFLIRQPYH
jgi:hypothetical protein